MVADMDNVLKGILIGAGIILTCFIVSKGLSAYQKASDTTRIATDNMNDFANELSEYELTKFDGLDIGGDDVINFFGKHLGGYSSDETAPIYINIITSQSNYTYVNGAYAAEIKNFTSARYVKPVAMFTCSVIRDRNKVVVGIKFNQK